LAEIKIIATHPKPHFDELTAIWLLRKFGSKKFPGIETAVIQYWNRSDIKETPETYETRGILLVGIGGGKFDEHPENGNARKENECAATLVAKFLGVDDDPALERILRFTLNSDLNGSAQSFDMAIIAKLLYAYQDPEKVLEWTFVGLEAKFQEQLQFLTTTRNEFKKLAQIEEIGYEGKRIKIATIISDDELISKFARSRHGGNTAVVIQQRSTGNVQIFTNKRIGIDLHEVAKILRLEEQRIKKKFSVTDWDALVADGKLEGSEEWYYHEQGQVLLNGSNTAVNIPATKIPLDDIRELVKVGLQNNHFHSKCNPRDCRNCYWQPWGLQRCRRLRYQNLHNR
jgi:hypothetical protein